MTTRIAVLGTCASEDWNVQQNPRRRLDTEIVHPAQQSALLSLMAGRPQMEFSAGSALTESEALQLCADFEKTFLETLVELQPDVLIVDLLLDSRRGVVAAGGSWLTRSYILERSGMADVLETGRTLTAIHDPKAYYEAFHAVVGAFGAFMKQQLPRCRVILHQARWAEYTVEETGEIASYPPLVQRHYFRANMRLPVLEAMFRAAVPCTVLSVDDPPVFADAMHVWGLSAIHYQKHYYAAFTQKLAALIAPETSP